MKSINHSVRIAGTGSAVPERIVTNAELCAKVATNPDWIEKNLGILERRVTAENEFTSDLAAAAGLRALAMAGISPHEVDLLILATATPDRQSPSTACIVQEKMGIHNGSPAFDISAVCSGFLYGLCVGSQFIQSGVCRNVLVIGADTFSKITDWTRRDCVFFGDGAGAALLKPTANPEALFAFELFADGRGKDHFTVYRGDPYFTMNARAVYDTATTMIPDAITTLLEKNSLKISDVSCLIPHQPSIRVLRKTAELLHLPFEKVKYNMHRYANTAGATVPLLLDETVRAGEILPGDLVLFAAVGSGWTWGSALYRWH